MAEHRWGPFSGSQLTAIVIALIFAALVPGSLWAVASFTNVRLYDPVAGRFAAIAPGNALKITDGLGSAASITVDGRIATLPAANAAAFTRTPFTSNGVCEKIFEPPVGWAAVILGIQHGWYAFSAGANAGGISLYVRATDGSCTGVADYVAMTNDNGFSQASFPAGLNVRSGFAVFAKPFGTNDALVLHGFYVPSASP